ncbi:MAG: AarF/ABC1/UbiB kinase family protein [Candidatus Thiodiazotropha sp.]
MTGERDRMRPDRSLPRSRISRLGKLGQLAGGMALGAVNQGARQLLRGERPSARDLLLTPANARRLSERLSELRGAAMKVGQLISMDSGQLLPESLGELLSGLRDNAHPMPLGEINQVLSAAWGTDWSGAFRRFNFTPMASASIGQVHEAELKSGERLAIKIQYPGVRQSIDSDVDNVAQLLRLFKQIPQHLDFKPVLSEAKLQLHQEADYLLEARWLEQYAHKLGQDEDFSIPEVNREWTRESVLCMSYMEGEPIEDQLKLPAEARNRIATRLLQLALREVFHWGLVQTDPNFSNFRYEPHTGKIQLLDFGATREYPEARRDTLKQLLQACLGGEEFAIAEAAREVGYLGADDPDSYRRQVVTLLMMVSEPLRQTRYDFATTDLVSRMSEVLIEMRLQGSHGSLPPTDVLFLHRKLGGLYLLLSRLKAELNVRELVIRML